MCRGNVFSLFSVSLEKVLHGQVILNTIFSFLFSMYWQIRGSETSSLKELFNFVWLIVFQTLTWYIFFQSSTFLHLYLYALFCTVNLDVAYLEIKSAASLARKPKGSKGGLPGWGVYMDLSPSVQRIRMWQSLAVTVCADKTPEFLRSHDSPIARWFLWNMLLQNYFFFLFWH